MNDQMPNVEQVIAGMRDETIREIGKDTISAAAQVAWYWSYIGALDMAQQLGLIDDSRRQALYHEAERFKPVCEIRAVQPGDHLAAAEMSVESNYNQIDGIINNEAPKPAVEESENEALYLVGGTAYLHIQTSEDEREYTHDDCFTTYGYTLYDKETMRQMDEGQMEVAADIRDTPSQIHCLAAQNILECRTLLGASSIEPVSMDVLETIRAAAIVSHEAPKPSLLDNLRQCREEAGRSQGGTAPPSPSRDPER